MSGAVFSPTPYILNKHHLLSRERDFSESWAKQQLIGKSTNSYASIGNLFYSKFVVVLRSNHFPRDLVKRKTPGKTLCEDNAFSRLRLLALGHDVHRVRAFDMFAVRGVAGQSGIGAVCVQDQFLGLEVEQQVHIVVVVHVLHRPA